MIKNYLLVGLRNLRRNTLHSSINILGLAIGMASCILITLFVQFELEYDRQNKNADRIYRLAVDLEANDWAISAFPLGALLKENFPQVENFTRIKPVEVIMQNSFTLTKNKEKVFYADSTVFEVLDISLIKGDPTTALAKTNSMVITEERARTYFGDEDPMGKTLTMLSNKREFVITGIFKPLPSNSHVHMNMMASSETFEPMRAGSRDGWGYLTNHYTYLVLPEGIDHIKFEKEISAFLDKYHHLTADQTPNVIRLQPLTSIHLHSNRGLEIEANGNMNTVYILSVIAFFILIIACINFMNLTTAQSLKRAREVGIRKVVGSNKTQLISQFMSESIIISVIALFFATCLLSIVIPTFNEISGKEIILDPLKNGKVGMIFLAITIFAGVFAGIYPAFFLSSFKPVSVLKGKFVTNFSGQRLRKVLVVFQFAIAFTIMVSTYVVYSQLSFMLNKDMGFDREQTLVVTMPRDSVGTTMVKNEMLRLPGVQKVTRFVEMPGSMVRTTGIWYEGVPRNQPANVYIFSGDTDLVETLGMKIISGTYFQPETQQFEKEFVINETALKQFGWTKEEAIGKLMNFGERGENPGKVIGVVEDFHFKHLHDKIDPLVLYLQDNYEGEFMAVKIGAENMKQTVASVEAHWKKILPQYEFEYQFLDESFDKLFDAEKRLGQLFAIFSGLAIFISCLGLFGLASFTMEQNKKSVAVRKVLGASVSGIVLMMSKDFLKLVVVGMVLSSPIAYFAMDKWLQGFAYNAGLSWVVFIYAAFIGILVASLTVGYHSLKAATSNPVNSLKEQ
jgi:putative ABC transport system permease protein